VLAAIAGCNAITDLGNYQIQDPDVHDCGVEHEDCAKSLLVDGGDFSRNYDGVTDTDTLVKANIGAPTTENPKDPEFKATLSAFRLDKFEVTVARFRVFLFDVAAGWTPTPGSGKHTHLNGGKGLRTLTGFETGWNEKAPLVTDKGQWDLHLDDPRCPFHTWTPAPGSNEKLPINCMTWAEAYAFCIWDHGFLPSEAELNYAQSGGIDYRKYPWGKDEPGPDTNLEIYDCWFHGSGDKTCTFGTSNIAPVGSVSAGNGKYGQADLAGNLDEWTLDNWVPTLLETKCDDCTYSEEDATTSQHAIRGGTFIAVKESSLAVYRTGHSAETADYQVGFRCARPP
jgi:formylglycine-generating enzyme required for sulfatase activity